MLYKYTIVCKVEGFADKVTDVLVNTPREKEQFVPRAVTVDVSEKSDLVFFLTDSWVSFVVPETMDPKDYWIFSLPTVESPIFPGLTGRVELPFVFFNLSLKSGGARILVSVKKVTKE